MTQAEADAIARVIATADGGCLTADIDRTQWPALNTPPHDPTNP